MEINIRKNGKYVEVKLKHDNVEINLGLFDDAERKELASVLIGAALDLINN